MNFGLDIEVEEFDIDEFDRLISDYDMSFTRTVKGAINFSVINEDNIGMVNHWFFASKIIQKLNMTRHFLLERY